MATTPAMTPRRAVIGIHPSREDEQCSGDEINE
jgi:hypothetical protein